MHHHATTEDVTTGSLATTGPSNLVDADLKLRAAKKIHACASPPPCRGCRHAADAPNTSVLRKGGPSSSERHTSLHACTDEQAIRAATWFRPMWCGAAGSLAMQADRTGDGRWGNAARVRFLESDRDHRPRNGPSGRTLRLV
jgi:hypothetical protein